MSNWQSRKFWFSVMGLIVITYLTAIKILPADAFVSCFWAVLGIYGIGNVVSKFSPQDNG